LGISSFGRRRLALFKDSSIMLLFSMVPLLAGAADSAGRFEVKIWE